MTGIVLQMVLSGEINNCILSILYSKCCGRIFKGAAGVGIRQVLESRSFLLNTRYSGLYKRFP